MVLVVKPRQDVNIKSALVTPEKDTGLKTSEIKILMSHNNWQSFKMPSHSKDKGQKREIKSK